MSDAIVCGGILRYPPGANDDLKSETHGKRGHHCTMYCEEFTFGPLVGTQE